MSNYSDESDSKHRSLGPSRVGTGESGSRNSVDRKSPPTDRVVQVLNLLADTPRERLTLTEIATPLGLNKPTCLGILTALTDAEFVTRDDAKSYGLGPALLRLGSAAEIGLATLDVVRPFLTKLYDRLGMGCILTAVHRDHIVILDRVGTPSLGDGRDLIGESFPLAPPLGLVNIAWEGDTVVNAWLKRPPLASLAAADDAARAIVDFGRERGYIVECLDTHTTASVVLASVLASGMPQRIIDEIRGHLPPVDWSEFVATMPTDSGAAMPVANISAPIFGRHGTQQYTLTLVPERVDSTVGQCSAWGAAVAAAAAEATAALVGGRPR